MNKTEEIFKNLFWFGVIINLEENKVFIRYFAIL